MSYWKDEPWADFEKLIEMLTDLYESAIKAGRAVTPTTTAVRKVFQYREWCKELPEAAVRRAVESLEMIYIPKNFGPGPGLCFPIRDASRDVLRLHIRLLEDGPKRFGMNYMSLTDKERFLGPAWVGDDDATVADIISKREVLLVEGPVDVLAVRAADCPIPSLSSTSKRVTDEHWQYLRILGVQRIYSMLDNEKSGQGQRATEVLARNPYQIAVDTLICPAKDPAECLKTAERMMHLKATFPTHSSSFVELS